MNSKHMLELPWDNALCKSNQTTAFIRPYTKNWNTTESDSLHLSYSYNNMDWYQLNGNNGIFFPTLGSRHMKNPVIYELQDHSYLIAAEDSQFPSFVYTVISDDLCHYKNELHIKKSALSLAEVATFPDSDCQLPVPIAVLHTLQLLYGKPEPVRLSKIETPRQNISLTSAIQLPTTVEVEYTNGMTEQRPVIWQDLDTQNFFPQQTQHVTGVLQQSIFPSPLIKHRADPYIYKHNDGYYYFTASYTDMEHNLDGKYQYLYILLRRAHTLRELSDDSDTYEEKQIYARTPIAGGTMSPHLWAPEIHFIQNKWYIYYTTTISEDSPWRIRPLCLECVSADPFLDEWINRGPMQTTVANDIAFTDFSLDHTHFEHRGIHYLLWAQKTNNISDIFIARLENPWTICTPSVMLTHPTYNWELHGFAVNEGPGVIIHKNNIFLTFSASGTDAMYCVGLLYADIASDLLDASSWTKLPHPIFQSSDSTGYYGLGHNCFTTSVDGLEDYIVFHGRQEARYLTEPDYQPLYDAGRHTYISKIYWDANGMPDFSVPGALETPDNSQLLVTATLSVIP